MTFHAGPVPAGTSLYIPFSTYAGSTGASATCTGLAVTDIEIYKNGSTTQRASDAGIALLDTDGIDFDGITGLHGFSIDLSDNTDASFYAVGSWYWVVVSAITVDSQTVTFLAATFRIAPAESITGYPVTDLGGISGDSAAADNLESACDNYSATRGLAGTALPNAAADAAGGLPISDAGGLDLDSKLANTNEVTAARMGALTDWINGGRLDLILDIIAADTTTDIPALISTAFASLQVNTRANLQVPVEIETPDTGTQVFKIKLHLFDVEGNMEAPDSTPTIALVNAAGTDRSSRLSSATVVSTGAYSWDYTATAADAEEQLNWMFTVVEGGLTRLYPATSYVVEETAYRFSSSDRNTLNSRASQTSVDDIPTNAEIAAGVTLTNAGARKVWTDDWSALAFAPDTAGAYVQRISTNVDGIVNTLGTPAGVSVSADVAAMLAVINALENLSAAEVNAEMLDVLNVDVFGELVAPPAASSSLRDKLTWVFMCHRNLRTETATQRKLFADNGSTLVGTEAVSDDGTTFTKGEVA